MLYTVDIKVLKDRVNIDVLKALRDLSYKYRGYMFFYATSDMSTSILPTIATIMSESLGIPELHAIEDDCNKLIRDRLSCQRALYSQCHKLEIVPIDKFDNELLLTEDGGFYTKDGDFFLQV